MRHSRSAIILLIVVVGCSAEPQPSTPEPTQASSPRVEPTIDAAIRDAIRLRTEFGLRADEAFVLSVASDPSAIIGYGIPMLPIELAELNARAGAANAVTDVIDAYASTVPDVFGGQYIDPATGRVYALFVGDLEVHRAALSKRLLPSAPLELLPARYSERALTALMAALVPNQAWLNGIGAPFYGASLETSANRVWLMVSGEPLGGLAEIYEHFGVAPDMLRISIEDRSLDRLPRGTLRGQLVDGFGLPVGGEFDVSAIGDVDHYEPDGGVGIGTNIDGSFVIERLAEMGWTIEIVRSMTGEVVGSAHTTVVGGQTTNIRIEVVP